MASHAVSSSSSFVEVDKGRLGEHVSTLTRCQKSFVERVIDWIKSPRKVVVVVSGGPGTGKSYVVRNTLDCFLHSDTHQLRMSYTARSARAIGGRTIHSTLRLNPQEGALFKTLEEKLKDETDLETTFQESRVVQSEFKCSTDPLVIVVDEVSMINAWLMYWIIDFFMKRTNLPLLFVCMGDPHQLHPVKSVHNFFSVPLQDHLRHDLFEVRLRENKRFTPEYGKTIDDLRRFVDENDETGLFTYLCGCFPVVEDIDESHLERADKAMAFKNQRVKAFNRFYLERKVSGESVEIQEDLFLKPGCMVFVTKNGNSRATNGTPLVFESYDPLERIAICRSVTHPHGEKKEEEEEKITVCADAWTGKIPLDLGFAATVHKYQGDTIDEARIVICFDECRNLNLVYTALSRVRSMEQIVAVQL